MAEKRKRKTGIIVLWILLLGIVLGVATLAALQWNNIRALWVSSRYTPEQQQELLSKKQEDIQKILEDLNLSGITPLSLEQEKMLNSGALTEDEALHLIIGRESTDEAESANLEHLIAKVYLLRSTFVGKLDSLEAQAKQEYIDRGGNVELMDFAQRFLRQGAALESQCDAQMEQILAEMKQELARTGKDMALISEIRTAYETEKSVKKAALLGKYW